ncbi:MAG: hypothetical protein KA712_07605, partial [Myxococcales bacterium]|nr:hypothetical protein [Myxococcales bacterium]
AAMPLVTLGLAFWLPAEPGRDYFAIAVAFTMGLVLLALSDERSQVPIGVCTWALSGSDSHKNSGWAIGLLVMCLGLIAQYASIAWLQQVPADNDGAYYFAVAKHSVNSGTLQDPVVWHFLTHPSRVPHAPFDYWQGLTSLLMIPPMWLFGASYTVAILTIALLVSLALILLWHLLVVERLTSSPIVQLAALPLFFLSPALGKYGFETESVPVIMFLLIAVAWCFHRGKATLAVVSAGLMLFTRSDSIFAVAFFLLLAYVVREYGKHATHPRSESRWVRHRGTSLAIAGVCASTVLWNWTQFGTLTTPGASAAVRITDYGVRSHVNP